MNIEITTAILGAVLSAHLLHHRLVMRHISFVEVIGAAVLSVSGWDLPEWLLMAAHLALVAIFVLGSLQIDKLSPSPKRSSSGSSEAW